MHNHKAFDQAWICVARHVLDKKNLTGEMKPKDLAIDQGWIEM
jgi:hypothetical protein